MSIPQFQRQHESAFPFRDYDGHKAFDIVNKIDSLYLGYSYEQKNLANSQKIEWLNKELRQIEKDGRL